MRARPGGGAAREFEGRHGPGAGTVEISVVIPTYNRSSLVAEAVASVLAQRGVDCEVIVVDDGSTDDTREQLAPLAGRVHYHRQDHAGVSSARNTGIRLARADWVAFLDSDDLWLPRKLAAQRDHLNAHPGFAVCQTGEIWLHRGRRRNQKGYHQKPEGHCFPQLLERCLVSPSAVMIRKRLLEAVGGFDPALPACEDYDLWLRIGWRHPFGLVREPLVIKRGGHGDQLSAITPALDRFRIQSLVKLLETAPLAPWQRDLVLATLRRKCAIYAAGCRKRGRAVEAAAYLQLGRDAAGTPRGGR
jgi:glycosyltransferase involved in cell wall biosynthesis